MKKYISMLSFVFIMGIVFFVILMGVDMIICDRIVKNVEYVWKIVILMYYNVDYIDVNFDEVFLEIFEERIVEDINGKIRYLYVYN